MEDAGKEGVGSKVTPLLGNKQALTIQAFLCAGAASLTRAAGLLGLFPGHSQTLTLSTQTRPRGVRRWLDRGEEEPGGG